MSKTKKYVPIKLDKEPEKDNPYYKSTKKLSKRVREIESEEEAPNFIKINSPKRK